LRTPGAPFPAEVDAVESGAIEGWAREVLEIEAEALSTAALALSPAIVTAVRAVAEARQPVVCCGVGKSGIVAAKVSATLSSLGIPALALPAGDAAHGDLGVVTPGSVVLLFSNSGSTAEILRILPALRAQGCRLIGLIGRAGSPLAGAVDVVIPLPVAREADHIGMAPTASTTLQMAMGDAIAVAASRLKGFSSDDFLRRHPAGQLGQMAQPVTAIMRAGDALPTVMPHMAFAETVSVISSGMMGAACVVDWDNRLLGLITDGDVRRLIQKRGDFYETPASQIMHVGPKVIDAGASLGEALAMTTGLAISVLPVVEDGGRLVGMVHMHDLLRVGR
jgi:arabinose-5-phosphate isomerase